MVALIQKSIEALEPCLEEAQSAVAAFLEAEAAAAKELEAIALAKVNSAASNETRTAREKAQKQASGPRAMRATEDPQDHITFT